MGIALLTFEQGTMERISQYEIGGKRWKQEIDA